MDGDNDFPDSFIISMPSSADLKGRQSVRATFRLSSKAIETLSIIAVHLGIKQKSLFDHLMEDTEALSAVAKNVRPQQFKMLKRVQKTYVLSRRTLNSLDAISKTVDAPRDALVEYSIKRLESLIENERKKHEIRKAVVKKHAICCRAARSLLKEATELLGEDDPVVESIRHSTQESMTELLAMKAFIEKGKIIETY